MRHLSNRDTYNFVLLWWRSRCEDQGSSELSEEGSPQRDCDLACVCGTPYPCDHFLLRPADRQTLLLIADMEMQRERFPMHGVVPGCSFGVRHQSKVWGLA
ncbi:hypothetical protein BO79DRAFT_232994 [Aspergillus costaricaensis CBS 115574]|uniref:Uncharacterized protein n=1 Tax=Aspergillus costaricaensis CBS 115574 TaxID=1448317 RepID=A0ACD1I1D1_9EURO|nr:hypothetical protein BO79DRAFT_232994 [Aspergillus costaricaensis CBS 115574]RAK83800.1 hypothetical protein BO79DRAFT_232994 [Aspergillus costaricaensis CBS 115574]